MYFATDVYGPSPVATPQLQAPLMTAPRQTVPGRAPGRAPGRKGVGESAAMSGDPVLVWVILLGLALALGWVSLTLQVG